MNMESRVNVRSRRWCVRRRWKCDTLKFPGQSRALFDESEKRKQFSALEDETTAKRRKLILCRQSHCSPAVDRFGSFSNGLVLPHSVLVGHPSTSHPAKIASAPRHRPWQPPTPFHLRQQQNPSNQPLSSTSNIALRPKCVWSSHDDRFHNWSNQISQNPIPEKYVCSPTHDRLMLKYDDIDEDIESDGCSRILDRSLSRSNSSESFSRVEYSRSSASDTSHAPNHNDSRSSGSRSTRTYSNPLRDTQTRLSSSFLSSFKSPVGLSCSVTSSS